MLCDTNPFPSEKRRGTRNNQPRAPSPAKVIRVIKPEVIRETGGTCPPISEEMWGVAKWVGKKKKGHPFDANVSLFFSFFSLLVDTT
jgi:hypothetical protein